MSSIDDRVVNMQFNNAQFQQGIEQTNKSLGDLNNNLHLDGATDGIDQVQGAANRFSLQNMESALENVSSHFSVFGAIAFSAIQHITDGALDAGKNIASSLIDPIVQGGAKRALALQQAQFQFRGLGLNIQDTMAAALGAVKGTAFGLDDAATAAAQLGASGITASTGLQSVLRSVAGVAAQTGSSYSNIANIFETVAGNGRLMGEQLNQLSSYGVNAAATLAKSLHTTQANVRDLVSKGKISFKQFSDAMNGAFGANAAKANETYSGALDNMHAALARIGADVASPYFFAMRDIFNALGPLFDDIHTAIGPLLSDFASFQAGTAAKGVSALNNLIKPGLIASITNVVNAIRTIGGALSRGFHQIFPDNTAAILTAISVHIQAITAALIPGTKATSELQRTFAGLFAIFDIFGRIIGSVISTVAQLFGFVGQGSGSFLSITASIGDALVAIDNFIKKTDGFKGFFQTIGGIIAVPLGIFRTFFEIVGDGLAGLEKIDTGGLDNFADDVKSRFAGLADIGQFFASFGAGVERVAKAIYAVVQPVLAKIGAAFKPVGDAIKNALAGLSADPGNVLNAGLFGGFLLALNGFFGTIKGIISGNGVAIVGPFKAIIGQFKNNLIALETATNVKSLEEIAIAIALLAASAVALSLVNSAKLAAAVVAMKLLITELLTAFEAFTKLEGTGGIVKTLLLVVAIEAIASAMLVLAAAVAILGAIPVANLIQGVAALAVVLKILTIALDNLSKSGPEILLGAAAIAIIAPAMAVLGGAVAILGAIPFANLAQGMLGLVAVLGAFVGALALMDKLIDPVALLASAVAIAIIAPALTLLTGAVAALGAIPFENLLKGVGAFVVVLAAMAGAILLLGLTAPEALLGALAISAVALSLVPLIGGIALLGALPLANLIQGMVAFTAALAILVGAVLLLGFTGPVALLGAAAIVAIALGIAVLAPALVLLSAISWEGIGRLLTVLSAGLGILVVMGILLIPASVGFLLLGAALILIGTGVFLAATGIGLLATGIGLLVLAGSAGIALFTQALKIFIGLLPSLGVAIGGAIVGMAVSIGEGAPKLIIAFVQILTAMLNAIGQVVPLIITVATKLIVSLVNALVILVPKLAEAGLTIIQAFLKSVSNHIGAITTYGIQIIVNFINAVAKKLPDVIKAGGNLVLSYINGLASYIKNNSGKFVTAGRNLFNAVVDGIAAAIAAGGSAIRAAGAKIGNALIQGAKNALGINSPSKIFRDYIMGSVFEGMEDGNTIHISRASAVGDTIGNTLTDSAVAAVKNSVSGISDAISDGIDSAPTIRPVLDLSDIQNKASQITGMLPTSGLSVDTSNDVATSVALQEEQRNMELSQAPEIDPKTGQPITFNQYNTSPKALSTSEVYRNTRNQLSILKGDLGVVDQSGSPQ